MCECVCACECVCVYVCVCVSGHAIFKVGLMYSLSLCTLLLSYVVWECCSVFYNCRLGNERRTTCTGAFFLGKVSLGCAVLLCLVCLFAFACFFLSSFSHLSLKHVHVHVVQCTCSV